MKKVDIVAYFFRVNITEKLVLAVAVKVAERNAAAGHMRAGDVMQNIIIGNFIHILINKILAGFRPVIILFYFAVLNVENAVSVRRVMP